MTTLLATIAMSLERSRKECQNDHLHPYDYQRWNLGEDCCGTFRDNWSPSRPL